MKENLKNKHTYEKKNIIHKNLLKILIFYVNLKW